MTCGCPIHIVGLGCRYPPLKNPGLTLEIHTFVRDRRPLYSISCHDQRMVFTEDFPLPRDSPQMDDVKLVGG